MLNLLTNDPYGRGGLTLKLHNQYSDTNVGKHITCIYNDNVLSIYPSFLSKYCAHRDSAQCCRQ